MSRLIQVWPNFGVSDCLIPGVLNTGLIKKKVQEKNFGN